MERKLNDRDKAWVDALRAYLGGGMVPVFYQHDGNVNAQKTVDSFALLKGMHKIDPLTGAELPLEIP